MCPHDPGESCPCRKPKLGMLLKAAAELDLDLTWSYMIDDAISDVEGGRNAGVASILVRTGRGNEQVRLACHDLQGQLLIVAGLSAAVRHILLQEGNMA